MRPVGNEMVREETIQAWYPAGRRDPVDGSAELSQGRRYFWLASARLLSGKGHRS